MSYHILSYPLVLSSVSSPIAMLPRRASKAPPTSSGTLRGPDHCGCCLLQWSSMEPGHSTLQYSEWRPQSLSAGAWGLRPVGPWRCQQSCHPRWTRSPLGWASLLPTAQIWGSALSSTECTTPSAGHLINCSKPPLMYSVPPRLSLPAPPGRFTQLLAR